MLCFYNILRYLKCFIYFYIGIRKYRDLFIFLILVLYLICLGVLIKLFLFFEFSIFMYKMVFLKIFLILFYYIFVFIICRVYIIIDIYSEIIDIYIYGYFVVYKNRYILSKWKFYYYRDFYL